MKTVSFICSLILSLFIFNSCQTGVRGSGVITSNEVSISDYTKLDLSGGVNAVYEQKEDAEPYLRIEIDDNLFPLLEISSNGNTLKIRAKDMSPTTYNVYTNSKSLTHVEGSGSVKVDLGQNVSTSNLTVGLSGSCDIKANYIGTTSLIINTSGSGKVNIRNIETKSIKIETSGSSQIEIAGNATNVSSRTSGSGNIKILELVADSVSCKISGSGHVATTAKKTLDADISGSGKIEYRGTPQITQSISGSGKIVSIE